MIKYGNETENSPGKNANRALAATRLMRQVNENADTENILQFI